MFNEQHIVYVLTLAILKENILGYYIYLEAFYGIVQGFFWPAGHSLINEYVGNESNKFISLKSILDQMLQIVFPIVLGVSIDLTSFSHVAKIVLLISLIQFFFF